MSETEPTEGGAIQPIGFFVSLSSDWRISRMSANIGDFVGATPAELLGKPVTSLFSPAAIHSLRNRLALLRGPNAVERLFSIPLTDADAHYDVAVHMAGDEAMIEAEPTRDHHHDRESTGTVRGMIAQLSDIGPLDAFFAEAARQMRALTGFDRVTIHRFDAGGGDAVVGAAQRGATASVMGDPVIARRPPGPQSSILRSLVSLVADVDAPSVPLVPSLDRRGRFADLSRTGLCAPSPAQVDRLRRGGVRAALSISIVTGGRPWGVIACHHHAPCCPSFERRSAAEWYAIMLAMQIEIRELRAELATEKV